MAPHTRYFFSCRLLLGLSVIPGTFYSADVYRGMPEVPRGKVKYLRVFQLDYKTYRLCGLSRAAQRDPGLRACRTLPGPS